jgi:uncharacterized protein YerC
MSQISKYPVSKEVYNRIFDILINTITGLYSKKSSSSFIRELLTPTEQIMLAKRLAIAFLLSKNYKHREISKILRVSTSTINRVAYTYGKSANYKNIVNKILQSEKMEDFWLNVGEVISKVLSSGYSKSSSWRYLRAEVEKEKSRKVF